MTWVHGKHTVKAGFQLFWLRYQCCALVPGQGQRNQYFYSNTQTGNPAVLGTTGDSLASELLGLPSTVYFAAQDFDFNFPSWAPYIEDKWQITPKLTITAGCVTTTLPRRIWCKARPVNWIRGTAIGWWAEVNCRPRATPRTRHPAFRVTATWRIFRGWK